VNLFKKMVMLLTCRSAFAVSQPMGAKRVDSVQLNKKASMTERLKASFVPNGSSQAKEREGSADLPNGSALKDEKNGEAAPKPQSEASKLPPPAPAAVLQEKTLICRGVVIDGTISAEGDIECAGTINGDMITKGNILLTGRCMGDIQAANIACSAAVIQGGITSQARFPLTPTARSGRCAGCEHGGSTAGRKVPFIRRAWLPLKKQAVHIGDVERAV
jgi:septum formation inhibitor MinC